MSYLETLRRIPDDIVLAIFAHDFDEGDGDRCVCGWAMREATARVMNIDADATADGLWESFEGCRAIYGGTDEEWANLYCDVGASSKMADVECAVVDRLNEIVS